MSATLYTETVTCPVCAASDLVVTFEGSRGPIHVPATHEHPEPMDCVRCSGTGYVEASGFMAPAGSRIRCPICDGTKTQPPCQLTEQQRYEIDGAVWECISQAEYWRPQ